MATVLGNGQTSCVDQIGITSGVVWRILSEDGGMSLPKLTKAVGEPRDLVMQAVGWLAREDKLDVEETSRGRIVTLRSQSP